MKSIMRLTGMLLLLAMGTWAIAQEVVLPWDSGYVNVREKYGALGDGQADDTAAFQSAINDGVCNLYIPDGVYVVSGELKFWPRQWSLQGQSRDGTIIRLKDACEGYTDPAVPKAVVSTFEMQTGGSPLRQPYHASVSNLTIDVGSGNPGAVGLAFFTNDQGAVRDVRIISSDPEKVGHAGLALVSRWPGPGLVQRLEVVGLNYGIWADGGQYGMTLEDIRLQAQRKSGIYNPGLNLFVRRLRSDNKVPAVQHQSHGCLMVLDDCELIGGSSEIAAVEAFAVVPAERRDEFRAWLAEGPALLARNIRTEGYSLAIDAALGVEAHRVAGGQVEQFVSHPAMSLFDSPPRTLGLAVQDPPQLPADSGPWANVLEHGAQRIIGSPRPNDMPDSGPGIQKAIDSGAATVYLPSGDYCVRTPIVVRGNVQRIVGMESRIRAMTGDKPLFRIESGQGALVIEHMTADFGSTSKWWIEHACDRPIVLRSMTMGEYRTAGGGMVFVEDVSGGPWQFYKQKVWARQLSCDGQTAPAVVNDGGDLWILGFKTESGAAGIVTTGGGRTEMLGGYLYASRGPKDKAGFVNEGSSVCLSYINRNEYPQQVRETRDGLEKSLAPDRCPRCKYSTKVPLYVGYKAPQTQPDEASSRPGAGNSETAVASGQ